MTAEPNTESRTAGIVSRGVAAVIDLCVALGLLGMLYLGLAVTRLAVNPTAFQFPSMHIFLSTTVTFTVTVAYLTVCWAVSGCTVGAIAMGLRVTDRRGGRVKPLRALLRAGACVLFPIGLAWVAIDARRRSVQDIVLGTRVLYAR